MKFRIAVVILMLLAVLVSGCDFLKETQGVPRKAELVVQKQELISDQEGNKAVLVTIKNVSQITIELAQVKVSFYDSHDNFIDSSTDSVMNLKPDDTWNFSLQCFGSCEDIKRFDLEVTTGTSSGGL